MRPALHQFEDHSDDSALIGDSVILERDTEVAESGRQTGQSVHRCVRLDRHLLLHQHIQIGRDANTSLKATDKLGLSGLILDLEQIRSAHSLSSKHLK